MKTLRSNLFDKFRVVNCLVPMYQPPYRLFSNYRQLLFKGYHAWLNTTIQLFCGIIDNILEGRSPYCKLENSLDPNITWLEEASAISWNIVNPDPWVGVVHPVVELC